MNFLGEYRLVYPYREMRIFQNLKKRWRHGEAGSDFSSQEARNEGDRTGDS